VYLVIKIKNLNLTRHSIIWSLNTSHEAGDRTIKILQFDFLQRFAWFLFILIIRDRVKRG